MKQLDVHPPKVRSYNMSRIKAKNTLPEILVRKFLHSNGFRFRLHQKNLPGKPDIVLKKFNIIIFINGCFWHGHQNCKFAKLPKTKADWWKNKIEKNIANDKINIRRLRKEGWNVITIWSCELKSPKVISTLEKLLSKIKTSNT